MTVMRLGLMQDLRKISQDFSCAMPHSTSARAAAKARLTELFQLGCRGGRFHSADLQRFMALSPDWWPL